MLKNNMCRKVIAASISPFDKFPVDSEDSQRNSFYDYIGFKTDKTSLSDNNLLTKFATSIVSSRSRAAVKRTLKLLGYKSDVEIQFKHNTERYFTKNNLRVSNTTFSELILNNQELYKRVLDDNNHVMKNMILEELSLTSKISNEKISDFIGSENLPTIFQYNSDLDKNIKKSLIRSLDLNISSVESVSLTKTDDNQMVKLDESSSGERSLLLLVCSIASKITHNSLILIDEPEISLHPEWQESFIDLIYKAFSHYKGCHFVIATHSPLIISNLPSNDCFILNMDKNKLLNSNDYFNRSVDYQLAKLFNTPGYQNEYLNRLCVSILSDLTKNGGLNEDQCKNVDFLLSLKGDLDEDDHVRSLIDIISNTLELIK